jgi:hypothetical protein
MPRLSAASSFVLGLAYERQDFALVRAHWDRNFTRKQSRDDTSRAIMTRVLQQIRQDGYVLRERYRFPLAKVLTPTAGAGEEEVRGPCGSCWPSRLCLRRPIKQDFSCSRCSTRPRST